MDSCDCALWTEKDALRYTWSYEGQPQEGRFTFEADGASWTDSWHQPEPARCVAVPEAWGLFTVTYTYEVPSNPPWGWRTTLSERPDGNLVLQMTNLAPWGEEGRAVPMTFSREG